MIFRLDIAFDTFDAELAQILAQPRQRPGKVLLAEYGPLLADCRLVPFALELVKPTDQAQDPLRRPRPLGGGLEEAAAGMGPAAGPLDLRVRAGIGGIVG